MMSNYFEDPNWQGMDDFYRSAWGTTGHDDPVADLRKLAQLAREAPDEEHRSYLAVAICEQVIDEHGEEILLELRSEMAENPALRDVVRLCVLRPDFPQDIEEQIRIWAQPG